MKKIALLIFILFTNLLSYAQVVGYEWLSPIPDANRFYDVHFVNNDTGYVVGDFGTILKTKDGGATWSKYPLNEARTFWSVHFVDANNGFICGDAMIRKTTDGGETWVDINNTTGVSNLTLRAIHFITKDKGFAVGKNGLILKTTNGLTWTKKTSGTTQFLYGVYFYDAMTGYAYGENTTLLKTIDGGETWGALTIGVTTNSIFELKFFDSNAGIAITDFNTIKTENGGATWTAGPNAALEAGFYFDMNNGILARRGAPGGLFKTADGGASYTHFQLPITGTGVHVQKDIHFPTRNIGYSVGERGTIYKSADGGNTWALLSKGIYDDFFEMAFSSPTTIYLIGYDGKISKSTDAGKTWTYLNSGVSTWLRDIYFTSTTTGYVVGNSGVILKTTDAGNQWTSLNSGTTTNLRGCHFLNEQEGMAVGEYGLVLKTDNGGASWTEVWNPAWKTILKIKMINKDTIVAVGDGYMTLVTHDRGTNWVETNPSSGGPPFADVHFINDTTGFVAGGGPSIYKTTDAGVTWTSSFHYGLTHTMNSVHFADELHGYAVGFPGWMFRTSDGGNTWQEVRMITDVDFKSVHFTNPNIGYALGRHGCLIKINNNYTILSTPDLFAGLAQNSLSVYPNPITEVSKIKFLLTEASEIDIKIFDLAGKEVKSISEKTFYAGDNEVNLNLEGLPTGWYLIKLNTTTFFEAVKVYKP